jgi:hypothetical protein
VKNPSIIITMNKDYIQVFRSELRNDQAMNVELSDIVARFEGTVPEKGM